MWDYPEFDDELDDWEPLRNRRARPIRILAILVVVAMVLTLVIPALLRALQGNEPDETRPDGVQAAVVAEQMPQPAVRGRTRDARAGKSAHRPECDMNRGGKISQTR